MSELAIKTASMMDCLPIREQELAYELVRRIVLSWDPDFTKLTPEEALQMKQAEDEVSRGETVPDDAIDWDAD